MRLRLATLALLLGLPSGLSQSPALAQSTVYVDVVNGNDSSDGQSPLTPVRTIGRGLHRTQELGNQPGSSVLVAPGVYSSQTEVLPLQLAAGIALVASDPVLGATIDIAPLTQGSSLISAAPGLGADTVVRGFRLRGGDRGVQSRSLADGRLLVQDCDISGALSGIEALPTFGASAQVVVERCRIHNCSNAIRGDSFPSLVVRETSIEDIQGAAVVLRDVSDAEVDVIARRCAVGISSFAILRPVAARFTGSTEDCMVGLRVIAFGPLTATIDALQVTVAGSLVGVDLVGGPGASVHFDRSILHENGTDVAGAAAQVTARDSFVPSGQLSGPGVLIVDPGFVDAAGSDYTLRRGALAIDGFNLAASSDAEDGNLDTIARRDYGAYEYTALRSAGSAVVGTTLALQVDGQPGSYAIGILDRSAASPAALDTVYGRLDLNPVAAERVERIGIDPATGAGAWLLDIPLDPSLVGSTWRVQALSSSAASPTGFAFTNSIELQLR